MHIHITLLPGDGIGPEVVAQGRRILEAVSQRFGHSIDFREALLGGIAIDTTGQALPEETIGACQEADAVLLGAVGGAKWDDPNAKVRPEQGLLGIRKALGLFANIRPVQLHEGLLAASPLRPELLRGVDLVVIRELTGGIYFGEKRRERMEGGERASDLCVYTSAEIERIVRVGADMARQRRKKLTSVDKANVLETSRLWRSVTSRIMQTEYPDIQLEHMLVDACAMHLIRQPAQFDVIVTENMFGDILTDEASMLAGSMGMLPSASLGGEVSAQGTRMGLYEPIHGSAPDIAGKGIANPMATILSVAMLLRSSLGLHAEADAVEQAVAATLADGIVTKDIAGDKPAYSTTDVGDTILRKIHQKIVT